MSYSSLIAFVASLLCALLALFALVLKRRSVAWLSFGAGMLVLAADSAFAGLVLNATSPRDVLAYERLKLQVSAFLPVTWILFSLCYSRGNYREFIKQWRFLLVAALVIPIIAVVDSSDLAIGVAPGPGLFVAIGVTGKLVSLAMLVGSICILLNLERTFRAAVGIMRWRIKYFAMGAALVFGARLYTSSQALLYSGIHGVSLEVSAAATLLGGLLIAYSLARTRLTESEIYPSRNVLQHSLTAVIAGGYLVCVGLMATVVAKFGGNPRFPLTSLLLMIGLLGMAIVLLSDRLQQKVKIFVTRHFRRPTHDYRKVWSALTERTGALIDQADLCRAAVKSISDTFELLSVSIWLLSEHDKALVLGASTSFTEKMADRLGLNEGDIAALLEGARKLGQPFDVDTCKEKWAQPLRALNPDHFGKGGRRVCVPLVSSGETIGLVTVADRVSGVGFSIEDLDLLKCIADQIASSLRNIQLSHQLVQGRELQAFQTMSAFFVHDLKNTASTLSLMLKNMPAHFEDPAFREDSLRGLSSSVGRINELISRLGLIRQELQLKRVPTDLNAVVASTLANFNGHRDKVSFREALSTVPAISADPEQIGKVLTNFVVNACEAVNQGGEVRVETAERNGWACVTISDNGCGMSAEFMKQSLFRPFQTTKKAGVGIGMFLSKMIVEAHKGKVEVESTVGEGTTFRLLLPVNGV